MRQGMLRRVLVYSCTNSARLTLFADALDLVHLLPTAVVVVSRMLYSVSTSSACVHKTLVMPLDLCTSRSLSLWVCVYIFCVLSRSILTSTKIATRTLEAIVHKAWLATCVRISIPPYPHDVVAL